MKINAEDRTTILIHGSNLHAAQKLLGVEVDYLKLLSFFRSKTNLIRAYYFMQRPLAEENNHIKSRYDWMEYNEYTVVTKPENTAEYKNTRSSLDIELSLYLYKAATFSDHLIVFCGDADISSAIGFAKDEGCKVTVCSVFRSRPGFVLDNTRRACDQFVELEDVVSNFNRNS